MTQSLWRILRALWYFVCFLWFVEQKCYNLKFKYTKLLISIPFSVKPLHCCNLFMALSSLLTFQQRVEILAKGNVLLLLLLSIPSSFTLFLELMTSSLCFMGVTFYYSSLKFVWIYNNLIGFKPISNYIFFFLHRFD